jgi:hypothetical protein
MSILTIPGGKTSGIRQYLAPNKQVVFKGWQIGDEGRAFCTTEHVISEEAGMGENAVLACPNELLVEVFQMERAKRVPGYPVQISFQPTDILRVPVEEDKKFFHRPSLSCTEGAPFR